MVWPNGIEKEAIALVAPSLRVATRFDAKAAADEQVVKPIIQGSAISLKKRFKGRPT